MPCTLKFTCTFRRPLRGGLLGSFRLVAGTEDLREVGLEHEVGRVLRVMAAGAHLWLVALVDVVVRRVGVVNRARAVTGLAAHVLAARGAVDAADASWLLPAGDVAAGAVEVEILPQVHQRLPR